MRRSLIALFASFFVLPLAAADARVVIGKSIAGVSLGDTVSDVKATLGEPRSDEEVPDEIRGTVRVLDYGATELVVSPGEGTVTSIDTTSRGQRLANGVGVGSTRKTLRRKVRRVTCSGRICSIGSFTPGSVVTTFRISSAGKIASIGIGYVID